jgi:glycosyltransferase involved in cell wall biosynthesis
MAEARRIAFIGNSLPRRCGIATFTTDLQQSISASLPGSHTTIVAMTDQGKQYAYPGVVGFEINDAIPVDYRHAAEFLNAGGYDVISLQHEFGIFGGESGDFILPLLAQLQAPIVTTLHTILAQPSTSQRRVLERVIDLSSKVVVMADKGRQLLQSVYQTPAAKILTIAHGVPDSPFVDPEPAKIALGFSKRPVILTFGLLSPNKGIEFMIDAMPTILERRPDAVYVVLGATHPSLVRQQGEAYRESLVARARALGIESQVVFLDQFVDKTTLLGFIAMCDVYVTPYLNEAQMTSGTLAYSFGLGKAIVSTPYWHAQELLANDRGVIVPFRDATSLATAVSGLLTNESRRQEIRERAYADSRSMTWERTAEKYNDAFRGAHRASMLGRSAKQSWSAVRRPEAGTPEPNLTHFLSMCDSTGLLQHAVHCVPDRSHGYCVDDNARALLLACGLDGAGEQRMPEPLASRFAAFVQHAWNPDLRRFRNFMGYDRRWLESAGSEDSHGRTVWALGACARRDNDASRRRWATDLFRRSLPVVEEFNSPRAWAFTLLGLDDYCVAHPGNCEAASMRRTLADRLVALMVDIESHDWAWFEAGLTYENARLSQALIVTGVATQSRVYTDAGLKSLSWLMELQTGAAGQFRPVGTDGFGHQRATPKTFDQQPVEAAATISACLSAYRANKNPKWARDARRAFAWFLGANDLGAPLVDLANGSCRDGLHADRSNENRGGESVLSYLLGLVEIRSLDRMSSGLTPLASARALIA